MFEKFIISNDPNVYEAWPDVVLTPGGKLICVFAECTHHHNRNYTRIMLCESEDRGRSWSLKRPLTEGTQGKDYYYNCARIGILKDKRLFVIVDKCPLDEEAKRSSDAENIIYFSSDYGRTWSEPLSTPLQGIVPDKLLELDNGRWIISAHRRIGGELVPFLRYSDNQGGDWSEPVTVAQKKGMNLCEVSILPMGNNTLVAFMRENSGKGLDCMKTISYDNGESWSEVINFPLPGCHRPVAGFLQDGRIMITYRFIQGGSNLFGTWCQNFFAAITDVESALALERDKAWVRIIPVDYDRSSKSDLGYSGWVQFPDGEIYIANYIIDDAINKGQIRGYTCQVDAFMLE